MVKMKIVYIKRNVLLLFLVVLIGNFIKLFMFIVEFVVVKIKFMCDLNCFLVLFIFFFFVELLL